VTRLVIDASVAIKWLVEEPGTSEAVLLRRHLLSAPDLLTIECSNILWKKHRRKELTAEEVLLAARLLERADIELAPMRPLLEPATRLAIGLDHPAYDCAYLALAEALGCTMVTADDTLCRKLGGSKLLAIDVIALADAPAIPI
jgi:predicted nucleic acid-binding protein